MADYYNLEEVSKDEAQKIYNKLEQRTKVRVKTIRWIIFFVWLIIIIWALSSNNGNHSTDIHSLLWDMN
jgi:amino acid permease